MGKLVDTTWHTWHTGSVVDVAQLQVLHDWMRANNVVSMKNGEVELMLLPSKPIVLNDAPPMTPEQEQAQELADLLYSSNGDADALMAMQRKTDERLAKVKA